MNNKGFSLVEVMIAAGMLGGLAVTAMKLTEMMNQSTATMEIRMEEMELTTLVRMQMLDRESCTQNLVDKDYPQAVGSETTLTEIKNRKGLTILKLGPWGGVGGKALNIDKIAFKKSPTETGTSGTLVTDLAVTITRNKDVHGGANRTLTFPLFVETGFSGNKVVHCVSSAQNDIIPKYKTYLVTKIGDANKVACPGYTGAGTCWEWTAQCAPDDQALNGDCVTHVNNMNTTTGDLNLSITGATNCDSCPNKDPSVCPTICTDGEYSGYTCRYFGTTNSVSGARILCLDRTL